MEPKGSISYSKELATSPCHEPDKSSSHSPSRFNVRSNVILPIPFMPRFSKRSLSLRPPHQNPVHTSSLPPYVLHAPRISLFYHLITRKIFGQQYRSKFLVMWSSLLPCHLVPLRPQISSSAPYSRTPSA